ncbi:hypothetical protein BY458DRAFT_305713 [Sporodiniella umbellata]|nr:hypothetical protein BY458DRAFT_305713 [Sporodiniella umbellata]
MNDDDEEEEEMLIMDNKSQEQRALSLKDTLPLADENNYTKGRRHESFSSSHSSLQHIYPMMNPIESSLLNINPKGEHHEEKQSIENSSEAEKYPFNPYSDRQDYEKIHHYYTERLSAAHQKIKDQQLQIQRLESFIHSTTNKTKTQDDYMNAMYNNTSYYSSNPIYPHVSHFPFRNQSSSKEELSQNWIPGYADPMRSTIKE